MSERGNIKWFAVALSRWIVRIAKKRSLVLVCCVLLVAPTALACTWSYQHEFQPIEFENCDEADFCDPNSGGYHYSGSIFGIVGTFSPFAWDLKILEWDPCPDQAPDCNLGIKVGPFGIWVGCIFPDDEEGDG
ncbi:MAG: hypothetical protein OXH52_11950 [Gammaproteobacteria bacterium]|nr:hypothetical protein [Gammaproteobacteria bacterium]